ncbi:hypothetical protein HSBAA_13730 [Vreelandella sulfidaeris]|uniref:Uncharacterized protein n=1 Tax=Vreelandella sulfidaeris TaxID=115553 RepID=A0A455U397_9GAMM|nr:hypothetical protein HSBAA_13730 [Halomonas sulfidaeris]
MAAWVGQLIVDGVVSAMETYQAASDPNLLVSITPVLQLVGIEALIIALIALAQRGLSAQQSLLRALLGQKVNVMILEKQARCRSANLRIQSYTTSSHVHGAKPPRAH